jgi:CheY-like chemotaxis protein
MDIQMPQMDGYAATVAIRKTKRADSDIPVLAMTANALKEDIEESAAAGMNEHMAKPIDFDACLKKLIYWCNK